MNRPKGKPKIPPTVEETETIVTLAASGMSTTKIAQNLGRSRGMVKNTMEKPEIQEKIGDEKSVLAKLYRDKARRIVDSINDVDIEKASLQQKSISSGVLLDKSLLLSGDLPQVSVTVLLDLVQVVRDMRDAEDARFQAQFRATHKPATITAGQ
jgi:DNA-binding CsgD family transcriptional regulator